MRLFPFSHLALWLRLSLLAGSFFGLAFCLLRTQLTVVPVLVGLGCLLLLAELVRYLNRSHRNLAQFLAALRQGDYSPHFQGSQASGARAAFYQELSRIGADFRQLRGEQGKQFQFLQTLVSEVEVGLLCLDAEEQVLLYNRAMQQLLRQPYLSQVARLSEIDPALLRVVRELPHGASEVLNLRIGPHPLQLSVKATAFKLQQKPYRLLSFQDIEAALQAQELAAWEQLMRMLTHEIMNSVTPLTSLSGTLEAMLDDLQPGMEAEALAAWQADSRAGLQAIAKRGQGLLRFIRAYRQLAQLPELNPEPVEVIPWIQAVVALFASEFQAQGIFLRWQLPQRPCWIRADRALLEQVLVNLLQNALEALATVPQPELTVAVEAAGEGSLSLAIQDNGPGIPEAVQRQMFVPFFTTKPHGSGIGLSLSRQLVQLHGGRLMVQAGPGQTGTLATVLLPGLSRS